MASCVERYAVRGVAIADPYTVCATSQIALLYLDIVLGYSPLLLRTV